MSLILPEKKQRKPPNSGITALIDLDILTYSIGFACQKTIREVYLLEESTPRATFTSKKELNEWIYKYGYEEWDYKVESRIEPEPIENCLNSVKVFMEGILEATNTEWYKGYLTGKGNFRDELATILPYKGNRTTAKPYHYQNIRDYLVKYWDAKIVGGMEADDALSIEMYKWTSGLDSIWRSTGFKRVTNCPIICSIDKDLKNNCGWHYNWNKDEKPVWISEEEATYNFYKQLLTGDRVDNIQGIPGIGPKKAEKILEGCDNELSMYLAVEDAYSDYVCTSADGTPDEMYKITDDMLLENARLLWMVRELDENNQPVMWEVPE